MLYREVYRVLAGYPCHCFFETIFLVPGEREGPAIQFMWSSARWKCKTACSKLLRLPRQPHRAMRRKETCACRLMKPVLVRKVFKARAQGLSESSVLFSFQRQRHINKRIYCFWFSQCSIVTSILVLKSFLHLHSLEDERDRGRVDCLFSQLLQMTSPTAKLTPGACAEFWSVKLQSNVH